MLCKNANKTSYNRGSWTEGHHNLPLSPGSPDSWLLCDLPAVSCLSLPDTTTPDSHLFHLKQEGISQISGCLDRTSGHSMLSQHAVL